MSDHEVTPAAGDPILTPGAASPAVHELVELLSAAGYPCRPLIALGAEAVMDAGIMEAARRFAADAGVSDDELIDGQEPGELVGPATWAALRAHLEQAAEPKPKRKPRRRRTGRS